ncbi:MAG: nucleoside-diphosphate kinase [Patescibacteria group bacterium]
MEQTLILVKPDGVERGLTGDILARLQRAGLKLLAIKMVKPTAEQCDRHYALTEDWMRGVYDKAKAKMESLGQAFPYPDHQAYGKMIKDGLVEFLVSAPVVAAILEGEQAVAQTRKIVGATEPASSAPGTIRGDFSIDTYALSNAQNRPLRNLIHASGTAEEAKTEIALWFKPEEILSVRSINDPILYDKDRFRL